MRWISFILLFVSYLGFGQHKDTADLRIDYFGIPSQNPDPDFVKTQTARLNAYDMFNENRIDSLKDGSGIIDADSGSFQRLYVDSLYYMPPHAVIYFQDSSLTLTMNQNVYTKITNAAHDLFTTIEDTLITVAGDSVTIVYPGDYFVNASISFSGTAADVYKFAVFKNGVLIPPVMSRSTSQTDIGNVGLPIYSDGLVAGDDLSLRIANTASDDDATVVSCSWVIRLIHLD